MKKEKSYEEAIMELEEIVKKLEQGELSLDESLKVFQKGMELTAFCSNRLDQVEKKITMLLEDKNGNIIEKSYNQEVENGF